MTKLIYGNHATVDIESAIRRSEIELSDYELKQGMLMLGNDRKIDDALIDKVLKTLSAIANNGPQRAGKVLIGVTDKNADATRVKQLDGIEPKKVGKRYIVGVVREAKVLGLSVEDYYTKWKEAIKNSPLSPVLRDSILSHIDYNSFYGLGVIVFTVPPQEELSYYGDDVYWRNGDSTEIATTAKQIAGLAQRF
ncbi:MULTISPECIES: AlbA family DNA-binding domain-containing protein [Cupriavidus]